MIRYLVGVDGSDLSAAALDHASQLARATGARLLLVHVAPHAETAAIGDPAALSALTDRTELHDMHGQEVLREALARAEKHGVQVETLLKHGPAAEMIAELAEGRDVAM